MPQKTPRNRMKSHGKWMRHRWERPTSRPETLNLEHLRGKGLQSGEEPLPEEPEAPAAPAPEADDMIVAQLLSMGIGENAAWEPTNGIRARSEQYTYVYISYMQISIYLCLTYIYTYDICTSFAQ